jgi:anti-sigma factor RsiW
MTTCNRHTSGDLDLYFYDELNPAERRTVEAHLSGCSECRAALDELRMIREALASRPDVSAPASGDWSAFMTRLDASLVQERTRSLTVVPLTAVSRRPYVGYLAMAALLALVTVSVAVALRSPRVPATPAPTAAPIAPVVQQTPSSPSKDVAFRAMTEAHFERSKLVVLGLATRSPEELKASDWAYERELASGLLNDTRLYRLAAEDRGLDKLAGVMRDLELVLLQTSLTDEKDPSSIQQIQRLIRRRDLIEKMDVVTTTGL